MRRRALLFLSLTASGALPACDRTPGSPSASTTSSPAASAQAKTIGQVCTEVRDALGPALLTAVNNGQPADAELARHSGELDRLVEATGSAPADFGVDYSQGLGTMIPHLGTTRELSRVLRADAARLLAAGNPDGAAKRTAAVLRLAAQVAKPAHTIIEMLVACALAQSAADFVTENPALAGAAWKTDIQNAIVSVNLADPFNSSVAVARDGDMVVRALREGKTVDMSSMGGRNWTTVGQAERDAAADRLQAINAQAVAAWNAPDAVTRLGALAARAQAEGVGDVFSRLDNARKAVDRVRDSLKRADAALSK